MKILLFPLIFSLLFLTFQKNLDVSKSYRREKIINSLNTFPNIIQNTDEYDGKHDYKKIILFSYKITLPPQNKSRNQNNKYQLNLPLEYLQEHLNNRLHSSLSPPYKI